MTEVQEFMRHVQSDYLFYDKENDEFCPIVFSEADEEHKPEVCFQQGDAIQTITDEQVYHELDDARDVATGIALKLGIDSTAWGNAQFDFEKDAPIQVFAFAHSDKDQFTGPARTIEKHVTVNRVGFGIFMLKSMLKGMRKGVDPAK